MKLSEKVTIDVCVDDKKSKLKLIKVIKDITEISLKQARWFVDKGYFTLCQNNCEYFSQMVFTVEEAKIVLKALEGLADEVRCRDARQGVYAYGMIGGPYMPWDFDKNGKLFFGVKPNELVA